MPLKNKLKRTSELSWLFLLFVSAFDRRWWDSSDSLAAKTKLNSIASIFKRQVVRIDLPREIFLYSISSEYRFPLPQYLGHVSMLSRLWIFWDLVSRKAILPMWIHWRRFCMIFWFTGTLKKCAKGTRGANRNLAVEIQLFRCWVLRLPRLCCLPRENLLHIGTRYVTINFLC